MGFLSGIIASLCCITPVVLIFLGLGSVSFAFSFIAFKGYFLLASLLFLGLGFWWHIRKKKCSVRQGLKSGFALTALTVHLILFIASFYLLLPVVGSWVFEKKLSLEQEIPKHPPSCHLQLKVSSKSFNALNCTSCEAALKYQLEKNSGVYSAQVDLSQSKALIHYNKEEVSSQDIIKSVPPDFEVKNSINQC